MFRFPYALLALVLVAVIVPVQPSSAQSAVPLQHSVRPRVHHDQAPSNVPTSLPERPHSIASIADSIKTAAADVRLTPQTGRAPSAGRARRAPSLTALLVGAGVGCAVFAPVGKLVDENGSAAAMVGTCAGGAALGAAIGYVISTR